MALKDAFFFFFFFLFLMLRKKTQLSLPVNLKSENPETDFHKELAVVMHKQGSEN